MIPGHLFKDINCYLHRRKYLDVMKEYNRTIYTYEDGIGCEAPPNHEELDIPEDCIYYHCNIKKLTSCWRHLGYCYVLNYRTEDNCYPITNFTRFCYDYEYGDYVEYDLPDNYF